MRFLSALSLTFAFVAAPVAAQDAQSTTPDAPAKERKICRAAPQTGSILGAKRQCHTKAEWTEIDATNKRNADNMMDKVRISNGANRAN